MSLTAPLRVPVEIRHPSRGRWFRLALEVSPHELQLASAAPEELDGPLRVAFHLPSDAQPIRCGARLAELRVGDGDHERAELRGLRLFDLDEEAAARIQQYLQERLGLNE